MSIDAVTARISQIQGELSSLGLTTSSTATAFASTLSGTGSTSTSTEAVYGRAMTPGGGATGDAVVADAKKYLGIPYVWGGTDPQKGMDCSGFVQRVYADMGYSLPRVSYQQATQGTAVASLDQAQPGDLLAFGSPVHHIAIYIGDGKMIEEPHTGSQCRISDVYETPTAIRRIIGSEAPAAAATTGTTATSGTTTRALGVDASVRLTSTPYAGLFNAASARTGVPAQLLAAVAKQESGFNPSVTSGAGAQGLMQLMPGTARGLGVTNPFDPAQAIDGGARLLKSLLDKFDGRVDLALAGYNAGAGAVTRYGGVPPYKETQNYVSSIMSMLRNGAIA